MPPTATTTTEIEATVEVEEQAGVEDAHTIEQ